MTLLCDKVNFFILFLFKKKSSEKSPGENLLINPRLRGRTSGVKLG